MEFYLLTKKFYEKYSNCKEILKKENRPYTICIIEINKLTFAIPIRHNINHKYSIKTFNNQGLDFTKAVIIIDKAFISEKNVYIEQEEYEELSTKKLQKEMRRQAKKILDNKIHQLLDRMQYNDLN
mgnify:CR=1 FL=1